MKDKQVLEMWGPIRKRIIESHKFYVDQAQVKLLSQFNNMEEESEKYAEEWIEKQSEWFDPDIHDPDDIYESAYDENISYYIDLCELKDQTRLSIVAGIYHKWDKEVREWLIRDLRFYPETIMKQLWIKDIGKILDIFIGLSWNIKNEKFYEKIDACRLVVNVYKHGNGKSLDDLKTGYPEYIDDLAKNYGYSSNMKYLNHSNLKVTDEQLIEFADAITNFWETAPERFVQSQIIQIPNWPKR